MALSPKAPGLLQFGPLPSSLNGLLLVPLLVLHYTTRLKDRFLHLLPGSFRLLSYTGRSQGWASAPSVLFGPAHSFLLPSSPPSFPSLLPFPSLSLPPFLSPLCSRISLRQPPAALAPCSGSSACCCSCCCCLPPAPPYLTLTLWFSIVQMKSLFFLCLGLRALAPPRSRSLSRSLHTNSEN